MLDIHLKRRQGDFLVDVAIAAGPGVTALYGPSGSGKTSVISMVAGLSRPDDGRILLDGRALFDKARNIDLPPEKRRLGYVFQEGRLFPHLSVRGNLLFGHKKVPPAERKVTLEDVVEVLGIAPLLDRHPARLSGGEKQRVAIGRALLAHPRLMLMDEPLSALDPSRKAEVLPFIGGLSRQFNVPILYVSHAMDEVLRLADTLVLLQGGRVVAGGPVEDLLSRPDLCAHTGRAEAGSVIVATVAGHDGERGLTRLDFAGGPLVIGWMDLAVGARVRVRIHARDVAIALDPPTRTSMRNAIPAIIRSISPGEGHVVDVVLDCGGAPLWAQITAHSQALLGLAPGQSVHALLKAVTVTGGDVTDRINQNSAL